MWGKVKNILVVDDEPKLLEAVASYLESKGFHVYTARDGKEAMDFLEKYPISFVVLDLMLPGMSGEEICRQVRKKSRIPILMLTAKTQEEDLLNGLYAGADDYMTKPFSLKVLYARIQAVLRRSSEDLLPLESRSSWRNGDLIVDFEQNIILKQGIETKLTVSERKLLSAFIKYPGKIFTREELIAIVFDTDFNSYDRVIDTHIKNLRQKIEDNPKSPVYILTIYGTGYKFGGT